MWGQPPSAVHRAKLAFRAGPGARNIKKTPPGCARRTAEGGRPHMKHHTGVAVFLGGLKNGRGVTFTFVLRRIASIVISIWSEVPGFAYSVSTLASAISFFRIGDQLVVVTLPACLSPEYTGTATREACAGAAGVRPQ